MTKANRQVLTITLLDNDQNLPVDKAVVATFKDIVTEDTPEVTIQQILVDQDIKAILKTHNEKRVKCINNQILERTGNEVTLQPVTIKDLSWDIK